MRGNKMKIKRKANLVAIAVTIIYLFIGYGMVIYSMENHPVYIWFSLFWLVLFCSLVPAALVYGSFGMFDIEDSDFENGESMDAAAE